ncbi:anhydro-N-acetylmuramic acid kinase, partial [Thioclava sp. BHET1]
MAKQVPLRVLGLMSGTSLDGVDAAVLVTDGHRIEEFGERRYRPYSPA